MIWSKSTAFYMSRRGMIVPTHAWHSFDPRLSRHLHVLCQVVHHLASLFSNHCDLKAVSETLGSNDYRELNFVGFETWKWVDGSQLGCNGQNPIHSSHACACFSKFPWNHYNFGVPRWKYKLYIPIIGCISNSTPVFSMCIIITFGLAQGNVVYCPNASMEIPLSVLYLLLLHFNPSSFQMVALLNRYGLDCVIFPTSFSDNDLEQKSEGDDGSHCMPLIRHTAQSALACVVPSSPSFGFFVLKPLWFESIISRL